MKRNTGIKIIIKFLLVCFAVSCSQEMDIQKPEKLTPFTVSIAKMWFDTHLQPIFDSQTQDIVKSGTTVSPVLTPDFNWAKALTGYDGEWSVVELPWAYENGMVVFNREGQDAIDQENPVDTLQLVRLVIAKNLKTQDVYAFRMVVLPDPEYFEQGGNLQQNQYLTMQPDFSGLVLFYDIRGEFVVGYKYELGNIVDKLVSKPSRKKGTDVDNSLKNIRWVAVYKCWYQISYNGNEINKILLGCTFQHMEYTFAPEIVGGGGGGFSGDPFGGGGGGGNGPTLIIPPGKEEYVPSDGDVFFRERFDKVSEPQIGFLCFFEAMAYVSSELCRRSINSGLFILSYASRFNVSVDYIMRQGASGKNVLSLLRAYFREDFTPFDHEAINNGRVIITDIAVSPGITHAVVIVGYKQNGRLIFMDPANGRLREGHPSIFRQSFRFVAQGCK